MAEKGVAPDLVNQFAHPIDSLKCDEETTPSEISQQTLGSSTTRTDEVIEGARLANSSSQSTLKSDNIRRVYIPKQFFEFIEPKKGKETTVTEYRCRMGCKEEKRVISMTNNSVYNLKRHTLSIHKGRLDDFNHAREKGERNRKAGVLW